MSLHRSVALAVLALALPGAAPAHAAQCAYQGSGDWNDGLNWSCGHVPGPQDDALIGGGATVGVATSPVAAPGSLVIDGGHLSIAGTAQLDADPVLDSGVLTGAGTVGGDVMNAGGVVRPGSGVGTLRVTGAYSQGAAGRLELDIEGTGAGSGHDALAVGGAVAPGGALGIVRTQSFVPADDAVFQIVTSGSPVAGDFATSTGGDLPGGGRLTAERPQQSPFGLRLVVTRVPPPTAGKPRITGLVALGRTLTCDPGSWSGDPTFGFQWLRNGGPIPAATGAPYVTTADDVDHELRCRVDATNAGGTASATSDGVVTPAVPPNPTTATIVSGQAAPGRTLTCTPGGWSGVPAPVLSYQWTRNGQPIAGATRPTYGVGHDDAGLELRCEVTGGNSGGRTRSISAPVSVTPTTPLLLTCRRKPIVLVDVARVGKRIRVIGQAELSSVGRQVRILLVDQKRRTRTVRVATATVGVGGVFSVTFKRPPKRYRAPAFLAQDAARRKTRALSPDRRVVLDSLDLLEGEIVLRGHVAKPLPRPGQVVRLKLQTGCNRSRTAGTARISSRGRFRFTVKAPTGAAQALVRVETRLPRRRGGRAVLRASTLPWPVNLD